MLYIRYLFIGHPVWINTLNTSRQQNWRIIISIGCFWLSRTRFETVLLHDNEASVIVNDFSAQECQLKNGNADRGRWISDVCRVGMFYVWILLNGLGDNNNTAYFTQAIV